MLSSSLLHATAAKGDPKEYWASLTSIFPLAVVAESRR